MTIHPTSPKKAGAWCAILTATILAGASKTCLAYEVQTHALLVYESANRSIIFAEDSNTLEYLGLLNASKIRPENPLGSRFFDVWGTQIVERKANPGGFFSSGYERDVFAKADIFGEQLTLRGWLARGGFREDDYPTPEIPNDDLCNASHNGRCYRLFHHFYDPQNDRALTHPGARLLEGETVKSPTWALGVENAFAEPMVINPGRRNHFSIADAREYMYRAMTLRRFISPLVYESLVPTSAGPTERAQTQAKYWASTFRALGSVVHHIQDMAQPQHTRDDQHSNGSFYEAYVDARVQGAELVFPEAQMETRPLPTLELAGFAYPVPTFDSWADYWTTARTDGVANGRGIADYSSRGFYTAGTVPGSRAGAMYPYPPQNMLGLDVVDIGEPTDLAGQRVPGKLRTYAASVADRVKGESEPGVKLVTYGVWDEFLESRDLLKRFTLNHYNVEDNIKLLIPRAIGYSTGVINHFFRGKLSVLLPTEQVFSVAEYSKGGGFDRIKVFVQNATEAITPSGGTGSVAQSTSGGGGSLVAVLRYRLNTCLEFPSLQGAPQYTPLAGAGPVWNEQCREPPQRGASDLLPLIVVSEPRAVPDGIDQLRAIVFTFTEKLPFNAIDVELQVIYRGKLGGEPDGIAVGFEQLSEPTFLNFENNTDCQNGMRCEPGGCPWAPSAGLPFVTSPELVDVSDVGAGQLVRVAFLTIGAMRRLRENGTKHWVANNQDFAYPVPIMNDEVVEETWQPGVTLKGEMFVSRPVKEEVSTDPQQPPALVKPMLTWRSKFAGMIGECSEEACFAELRGQCTSEAIVLKPGKMTVKPFFWQEF